MGKKMCIHFILFPSPFPFLSYTIKPLRAYVNAYLQNFAGTKMFTSPLFSFP